MPGGSIGSRTAPASDAPLKPMSRSERLDAIDVLRGLALFGVLAMNIVTIFRVSFFSPFLPNAEPAGPLDRAEAAVLTVAVDFKALSLFSLLFGVGLAIQFERLAGNARPMILLVRRAPDGTFSSRCIAAVNRPSGPEQLATALRQGSTAGNCCFASLATRRMSPQVQHPR